MKQFRSDFLAPRKMSNHCYVTNDRQLYIYHLDSSLVYMLEYVCCCAILTTGIRARRDSLLSVEMENLKIGIKKFDGFDFGF